MNSNVKNAVYSNYQGNTSTFITEIIGEMKYQFNKSEHKTGVARMENNEVREFSMDDNERVVEMNNSPDVNCEPLNPNHSVENANDICESKVESSVFKIPSDEVSYDNTKDPSPTKRSPRQQVNIKTTVKRSLRCRGKRSSESILQSAIARKEKSYNESNKPQRLSRQKKSTKNCLDIKEVKIENNKQNGDNTDDTSTSDGGMKIFSSEKNLKKKIKRQKLNFKDKFELDSVGSTSDENECLNTKQHIGNIEACDIKEDSENISSQDNPIVSSGIISEPIDSSSAEYQLISSRLCLCTQKTNLFADIKESELMYCTAIDSIEEKFVGCSRIADVKTIPFLRPSRRVPYQIMCDFHKNRLIRHNCCPTCGIFCTQGRFAECKAKHQYHRKCQISVGTKECCPHCGISSPSTDVFIKMHCEKKPIFLPTQKPNYPTAKMSFFLPVEDHDSSSRTCPPLFPPDTLRNLNQFELNGETFTGNDLIDAIREGDEEKIGRIIVSNSLNLHFKISDFNNGTLLHYAAYNGLLTICHLLVSINFDIDEFDYELHTPLMLAILSKKNNVVNYLIRAGASTSVKSTDGITALHMAAKCGNLDAIKFVLRSSIDINFINCQDDGGWTPLVWACEHGHIEVVSYLISNGADPNLRDVEFNEALHWAAFSGSSDSLELLLNAGCDVNSVNIQGETPLHITAREDRTSCLIMLLARGADVSIRNKNNESPLDYVSVGGEIYNILFLNLKLQSVIGSNIVKYKTILCNDITRGRESNPVRCVNYIDDEPEPTNFVYITKNYIAQNDLSIETNITSIHSCSCIDNCLTINCDCAKKSTKCWYEDGRLSEGFNFADPSPIFECNDKCGCNAITCRNRLVQKGLTQRFQIFKTEGKGWGLKTLRFIPKGSFVCEYIGEILTDTEADTREDDSFLFSLSSSDAQSFSVDAKRYGNISRFINHSCSSNLCPVKLFVDHQDLRFPRIALFAYKDILADEELSFDYGQRFWRVKCKIHRCKCNVPECQYSSEILGVMED